MTKRSLCWSGCAPQRSSSGRHAGWACRRSAARRNSGAQTRSAPGQRCGALSSDTGHLTRCNYGRIVSSRDSNQLATLGVGHWRPDAQGQQLDLEVFAAARFSRVSGGPGRVVGGRASRTREPSVSVYVGPLRRLLRLRLRDLCLLCLFLDGHVGHFAHRSFQLHHVSLLRVTAIFV